MRGAASILARKIFAVTILPSTLPRLFPTCFPRFVPFLLFIVAVAPLGAVPINSDCGIPGSFSVGDCTFDDQSGLHWLDWTLTTNRSYDDVSASLAAEFPGFRYATEQEVLDLLLGAGINGGFGHSATPLDPDVIVLQGFLGITAVHPVGSFSIGYFEGSGCGAPPCSSLVDQVELLHDDSVSFSRVSQQQRVTSSMGTAVGHALVATGAAMVPEPSTLALLGLGIAAAMWRRRALPTPVVDSSPPPIAQRTRASSRSLRARHRGDRR